MGRDGRVAWSSTEQLSKEAGLRLGEEARPKSWGHCHADVSHPNDQAHKPVRDNKDSLPAAPCEFALLRH